MFEDSYATVAVFTSIDRRAFLQANVQRDLTPHDGLQYPATVA